jgi:glycosyltransferase involved in cell wall biosynthesis
MKLLFLAPQPFFQERGTPIAVRLALEVIAERFKYKPDSEKFKIDLLCYHEGIDLKMPGVEIIRICPPGILRAYLKCITPGISIKKLICDIFFIFKVLKLLIVSRKNQYSLIHAVEESVFIALLIKAIWGIPYIYDMDSSLAMQVSEKWPVLKPIYGILSWFEKMAVKHSLAVAPVCDSLGIIAEKYGAKSMVLLRDVSLLNNGIQNENQDLKSQIGIDPASKIILYVGNLEVYQGIDLLLESFSLVQEKIPDWHLVIIGGNERDINSYRIKAEKMGISKRVVLAGPRPVALLGHYIKQAEILVSPRIKGNNTPMKIYSYLHSGRALIATRLPTHTQVLSDEVCVLSEPHSMDFSKSLLLLAKDPEMREKLATKAFELAEKHYTYQVFSGELNRLYDLMDTEIAAKSAA